VRAYFFFSLDFSAAESLLRVLGLRPTLRSFSSSSVGSGIRFLKYKEAIDIKITITVKTHKNNISAYSKSVKDERRRKNNKRE
jgi:hypothetical protein